MDKYYIPKSLDEPFRIYLLTIDEFILLLLPILIFGFILNELMLGLLIGLSGLFAVKKLKGEQGHFYLANLAYWYLPPLIKFHVTPPSYIKHYLG
jgi:type IV conjugative transfer system protein TraL